MSESDRAQAAVFLHQEGLPWVLALEIVGYSVHHSLSVKLREWESRQGSAPRVADTGPPHEG